MGFRFRRSIKLLPGVRLNVSGTGASLSLGGPGATVNFSSRGARATFGIPGTGLSLSTPLFRPHESRRGGSQGRSGIITSTQDLDDVVSDPNRVVVYAKTQRRLSAGQIDAAYREFALQERHAHSQQRVAKIEADERAMLESWRDAAGMLSADEQARALYPRTFVNPEPAPRQPDYGSAETILRERLLEDVRSLSPRSLASRAAGPAIGATVALAAVGALFATSQNAIAMPWFAVLGIVATVIGEPLARRRWERDTHTASEKRADSEWPVERVRLEDAHASAMRARAEREITQREEWDAAEVARIAWATALFNGDLLTIEQTVFDSLDDIDFPFESDCTIAAEDASKIFVNLDAPEIEDVIPETRFKVLKGGTIKEVKRKAEERNAKYAQLVFGIVISVAATVFSAAPTVQSVAIAAFTQRKRRGVSSVEDAYVLETLITRDELAAIDIKRAAPADVLSRFRTRVDGGANLSLKKISIPTWASDMQSKG